MPNAGDTAIHPQVLCPAVTGNNQFVSDTSTAYSISPTDFLTVLTSVSSEKVETDLRSYSYLFLVNSRLMVQVIFSVCRK